MKSLRTIWQYLSKLLPMKVGYNPSKDEENSTVTLIGDSIDIDFEWDDICSGIGNSNDASPINKAFNRYGYKPIVSNSFITIDDIEYIPEQLSNHWELFHCSPKAIPLKITYVRLKC